MNVMLLIFVAIVTQVDFARASGGNHWTYRGSLGPEHWHLDYEHCGGTKQSPIDVIPSDVIVDAEYLKPIVFSGYDNVSDVNYTLVNNGHSVQVNLDPLTMEISGGGLDDTFVVQQFHFHWGAVDSRGSEHAVNGRFFPMEMHIVHYNKKYDTFTEAVDKDDGLAVLGFFFEVGRHNSHMQEIIEYFKDIQYQNEHVAIHSVPLADLIPARLSHYYRYKGSLTTPPCYESVSWTLFNETIEIAEEQLDEFRTAIFENEESNATITMDISDDFRPVQCLNRRRVYASHESLKYSTQYVVPVPEEKDNTTAAAALPVTSFVVIMACLCSTLLNSMFL